MMNIYSLIMVGDTDKSKSSNRAVGNKAEELVCWYLEERGYRVIERNFRTRSGEIDIVTDLNGLLVFVEVKARYSHDFGLPIESITESKLKFLKRTAEFYIHQH